MPKHGWQPVTKNPVPSVISEEAAPGHSTENHGFSENWNFKVRGNASTSSQPGTQLGRHLMRWRLLVIAGISILIGYGAFTLVWPQTNEYVFQQHPLYQANMAALGDRLKSAGSDFIWPYEGHEDRLYCVLHSNGSAGGDSSTPLPQDALNLITSTIRLEFCSIRYQSGFPPEEAVQCQVYVLSNNGTDKGYEGPGVSPGEDETIKAGLTNGSFNNLK